MDHGDAMRVAVPLHDWGCQEIHGTHPRHTVVWPDGRQDEVPTCCYEQGILIDQMLEPFERVERVPGLTVTDDLLDATMTLHHMTDDVYLLVFGRTDERDGGVGPSPMYETVSVTAIRGDRSAALAAWNRRISEWNDAQEFHELEEPGHEALLRWAVEGFSSESAATYRDYLAPNPGLPEEDVIQMIGGLEELGYLITLGDGLDEQPTPTARAALYVTQLEGPEGG